MTSFLSRLFGGKKEEGVSSISELVLNTTETLLDKSGVDLTFEVSTEKDSQGLPQVVLNFSGADEELMKEKEGQLIDAFQLFLQRVVQHHFPEDKTNIVVDCSGYREESTVALVELADKLKSMALEKGKSVYCRALGPKDRKIVHQHLANDARVKSRSIGDGLFKKIKIYPVRGNNQEDNSAEN